MAHQARCACLLELHSEPVKPHLPCSLRCCCFKAVSAYQVQLADCASAAVGVTTASHRADKSERAARGLVIGMAVLVSSSRIDKLHHFYGAFAMVAMNPH